MSRLLLYQNTASFEKLLVQIAPTELCTTNILSIGFTAVLQSLVPEQRAPQRMGRGCLLASR